MPFRKGDPNINRNGRPKGISITDLVKRKLQECPGGEDKKTYASKFIETLFKKALKDEDVATIRMIWNYIDGLPRESIDLNVVDKRLALEELESNFEVDKQGKLVETV